MTARPTSYTLTRIANLDYNPELLETYVDGTDGEPWTGGSLRHEVGDSQIVNAHVAAIVMTDPGLRAHYRCDPPFVSDVVETLVETHTSGLTPGQEE